jgi:hypothetical protein
VARLDFRFDSPEDAEPLVHALRLDGRPVTRSELAPKIGALAKPEADEKSPDFEHDHLDVLEKTLDTYSWPDSIRDVYADLLDEVRRVGA